MQKHVHPDEASLKGWQLRFSSLRRGFLFRRTQPFSGTAQQYSHAESSNDAADGTIDRAEKREISGFS
jgi:hypothetical protein